MADGQSFDHKKDTVNLQGQEVMLVKDINANWQIIPLENLFSQPGNYQRLGTNGPALRFLIGKVKEYEKVLGIFHSALYRYDELRRKGE